MERGTWNAILIGSNLSIRMSGRSATDNPPVTTLTVRCESHARSRQESPFAAKARGGSRCLVIGSNEKHSQRAQTPSALRGYGRRSSPRAASVLSGKSAGLIRDGFSSTVRRATQEYRESFEVAQQSCRRKDARSSGVNFPDSALARIDHRFGNEGDFGRPERFSESFAIDPVQVE